MELLIVLLLCTIQLSINPSPAMASTGSPVVHLQSAVTIANHSSILFWFCTLRHRRKRMPLEHCCCITMQWMIEGLHLKSYTHVRGKSEWCWSQLSPAHSRYVYQGWTHQMMPTPLHSTHANPVGVRGQAPNLRRLPRSTTSGMVAANFAVFRRVLRIVHPKIGLCEQCQTGNQIKR